MMILTIVDYVVLAAVLAVVVLKILSDIRDVMAARVVKHALRIVAKKSFSPKLTVIIPLESLENTKRTLQSLAEADFRVAAIVAVNADNHAKEARALRYFLKKQGIKQTKVIARKQPNLMDVATRFVKRDLAVVLPDTARLSSSFYWDSIIPFGDTTVDALMLLSNVRPDKTLTSGIEVLMTAWRRYVGVGGNRTAKQLSDGMLPEGVIIRAKYSRRMPRRRLRLVQTRKSAYSIAARSGIRSSWLHLRKSVRFVDFMTVFVMTAAGVLLLVAPGNVSFVATVFVLLYGVVVWWSLGVARVSFVDRLSVLLLSPFMYMIAWSLIVARVMQTVRSR